MTLDPMLKVITGRFHPYLESALADHIRQVKQADPFAPLGVFVPSATLQIRLKRFLAVEEGLSLLNVDVLTFHQLALRLADEARIQSDAVQLPRVVDDLFFEQLVRYLVRHKLSGLTPLQHIRHASGTWGALWSTVRDLKDAGVDPAHALRGLSERCFDTEDAAWLDALFSLHGAVNKVGRTLEVGTADDLAESLIPLVPASRFLGRLRQAFYYGFYDLTQVQLSFFEAVAKTAPTTLFFPMEEGSSFGFARRFYDRYLQPAVASPEPVPARSDAPHVPRDMAALSLRSTVGAAEELASTCRTILDLVETNGYRFEEIGVVARTLEPYGAHVQSVFDRHRVPFTASAGRPLMEDPLCKVLLQLATLPLNDFYRTTVLDVVTSSLHVAALSHESSEWYRPDQWKLLVPALQITHGLEEWKRLDQASRSSIELGGKEESSSDSLGIAPGVMGLLWQILSQLFGDCAALPQRGAVGALVDAFEQLVRQQLPRSEEGDAPPSDPYESRLASTWGAIERAWAGLREIDAIGEEVSWGEFVELLTHAFERTVIPFDAAPHQSVQVLDAMTARGLPFKALFILGLNEKAFPRYIREDAFLRDRHRRVLDETLGFKIDEKLIGYEEEALLFQLLCQAAGQRLYLSFQRADEAGRMLAPSPYIDDASRRFGVGERPVEVLPRRLSDRMAQRPSMRMFLPPSELAQWMAMSGQDPTALLQAVGKDADLFRVGFDALDHIEDDGAALTPFDGLTGTLDRHWARVLDRGMAPTPLERYARCPFQYFATDVLHLEPVRRPIAQGPDVALLGTLCHSTLRHSYEALVQGGWPAKPASDETIAASIDQAIDQAAKNCETRQRAGYYLLWELAKEQIASLVREAVRVEQVAQAKEPFTPIAFEVGAEGMITNPQLPPLKIHGQLDRVDRHRTSGAIRVVDYKYKTGTAMKPEDRRLVQSAVRGYRLQPPLYARMIVLEQSAPSLVQFLFLAPQWPAPIVGSTFDAAVWSSGSGASIERTIGLLAEGIRAGRYFILPDSYCEHCDFHVACRREHQPTWWRSYRAAEPKELKALRSIRVAED